MKDVSEIWDLWSNLNDGQLTGDNRTSGRVTVETSWHLRTTGATYAKGKRGPYRWFQRQDNLQNELELENLRSIKIDRSISEPAGTCEIVLDNQNNERHRDGGQEGYIELSSQLGSQGFYSPKHALSSESRSRWGQFENEWKNVFVPNALIRTYQGFGGHDKSLGDAIADGNITITGTWLVDKIAITSKGDLKITCRDTVKLLIEQQIYPPLVPSYLYPLTYNRYEYTDTDVDFQLNPIPRVNSAQIGRPPALPSEEKTLYYVDSSGDIWNSQFDAPIYGHKPSDSIDQAKGTFAFTQGHATSDEASAAEWFEFSVSGPINQVYIDPWGGLYDIFISIKEDGEWVDGNLGNIPYTPSGTDVGSGIKYVYRTSIKWKTPTWFSLPRLYNADRIRITFRKLLLSPYGGSERYRAGAFEFRAKAVNRNLAFEYSANATRWTRAGVQSAPTGGGYLITDVTNHTYAFGEAKKYLRTGGANIGGDAIVDMAMLSDGSGYYILDNQGLVSAYGNAIWYGDWDPITDQNVFTRGVRGIAVNNTDDGYWLLYANGVVKAFGSATNHGSYTTGVGVRAITADKTGSGYWIINELGVVEAKGSASHEGNATGLVNKEFVTNIASTEDGAGYWVLTSLGRVQNFGTATFFGELADNFADTGEGYSQIAWSLMPTESDSGYNILKGDGDVITFGDSTHYGSPKSKVAVKRTDGNYSDYTDVVKDLLLYSGFLYYDEEDVTGPFAHGLLERTGVHAGDTVLEEEFFDKKPVIDAINQIKEIVGFNFSANTEGGIHFFTPNWWKPGNTYNDGTRTGFIPEIDDRIHLTEYTAEETDEPLRSQIIIDSYLTDTGVNSPETAVVINSDQGDVLRGMVKPAMWINETFTSKAENRVMAELIATHIWFQQRVGSVSCVANPCIEPGDQVRILERNTSDTYIHYVRGVSTQMDLNTGEYIMTLETNWLGDGSTWVIRYPGDNSVDDEQGFLPVSQEVLDFLNRVESPAAPPPAPVNPPGTVLGGSFSYGFSTDSFLVGDFNDNGTDTAAVRRGNVFYLRNDIGGGNGQIIFAYGNTNMIPFIGNWNGTGGDTIGTRDKTSNTWYLRNSNTAGVADLTFSYGLATDIPIVGDWNGNGTTGIGVVRPGPGGLGMRWILKNTPAAGAADYDFIYGRWGDIPLVGNWLGTGGDRIAVRRANIFYLRNSLSDGIADTVVPFGFASDFPITGDWNGDGVDSVGIIRNNIWFLRSEYKLDEKIITF